MAYPALGVSPVVTVADMYAWRLGPVAGVICSVSTREMSASVVSSGRFCLRMSRRSSTYLSSSMHLTAGNGRVSL